MINKLKKKKKKKIKRCHRRHIYFLRNIDFGNLAFSGTKRPDGILIFIPQVEYITRYL
jgi:hypothetical protein